MSAIVGAVYSIGFDGVAGETYSRDTNPASFIDGVAVVWNPTITESPASSGRFLFTYTPTVAGWHTWRGVGSTTGDVTFNVQVESSASADPISSVGGLYATRAELKARIGATDTYSDDTYDSVLDAASRAIDGFTARRFYQDVGTIRYFTADDAYQLDIDDLVSVSEFATDTTGERTYVTTWDATDYDLEPYNAAATDWPYTVLCLAPRTTKYFVSGRRAIRITGTWGWPAIPGAVHEACLLLAARYAKRPSAPFGIDPNSADLGQPQQLASVDPDVKVLLAPYRKLTVGAV